MKIIPSSLAVVCAIPSAHAALRGAETAAAASSSEAVINASGTNNSVGSSSRKLWNYEGYTYTNSGTYETRFCYYDESNNWIGPLYDSMLECCEANFASQTSGVCISKLPPGLQPSAQPSINGGGLPGRFAAVHANGYEDGYCSNLKADLVGVAEQSIFDTAKECCERVFPDQNYCLSQINDSSFVQPSGQPTLGAVAGLGLPGQFVAVRLNDYEDGYCSNLKEHVIGTPSARIYDTEFECCQENFADQTSGMCISQLPDNLQPSGQPTLGAVAGLGLPAQYVAVTVNGFENGYCSNLKEHVIGTPSAQIYDTEFECCQENFADQTSGNCISQLPDNLQPSGQPTLGAVAGLGLSAQYVAVFANGYEDGYCSNLKEHVIGTPSAQIYDTEFECCQENFADQTSGYCVSQLPSNLQPSGQPTLGAVAGLGLSAQYVAVFANGYEDGYCSNLKEHVIGTPSAQIYDTEFECCQENFADQTSGYCISQLPTNLQPSGQPTLGAVAGLGLSAQYVAVFANGYEDGYCSNLKEHVIGTPSAQIYESEFECCQENFADQTSGFCVSQLPTNLQPSGQPTLGAVAGLGLSAQYVAVFANGYEDGYCSNLKEHVIGTPSAQIYDTEFECCQENFADQTSGYCVSQLPSNLQPSGQPTLGAVAGLGLSAQYVAVFANGYEDGYCSNLKEHVIGTPSAQIYDTEFECCQENFADQTSGYCISQLPTNLQPSGQPTLGAVAGLGLSAQYVAVFANGYEDGYCSNLKEHVIGTPSAQIYESEFECCQENFADQTSGFCVSQLPTNLQPSGQPTLGAVAGLGLSAQYVAVFANGYEDGYCSNLKEHVIGTPSAQIYDTEFECCQENFADQTSGYCVSQLPSNLQPSGQPTLGAVAGLGLSAQYVAVFANGYEDGYCSNLKEHVIGTPSAQIYDTEFECCQENFADQTSGYCISQLPTNLQPSGQPTLGAVAGLGLSAQYVAVFANGYEDGYCSNLKEHVIGTPSAQIYESEFECCQENFADQTSGFCVSQLPTNLQPSGQPTLGAVAGLGLSAQYVAVFANGYEDGYCSNLKEHVIGTPSAQIYETEFECCQENFADQTSGYCISQLPTNLQPSGQPTLGAVAGLGLSAQYVAVFANGYEDGYCSNLKEHVIGTPSAQIYESEFECCQENFADQRLGYCVSQLPSNLQPSGQPTLGAVAGLGLSAQYVAVFANGYEDGYCSNLKEHVIGTPSAQIYETEFECCQENFADQTSGYCISQLPTNLQPSGQPTLGAVAGLGLSAQYVAVFANGYEDGYCSNLKEHVIGTPSAQIYETEFECCQENFADQKLGYCISQLPTNLQPSGQPTLGAVAGLGLSAQYVAVFANGYEDGYCSNLKEHVIGTPSAQIYESEFECCQENFADQRLGYCVSQLPTNLQPSGQPTLGAVAGLGLSAQYVAVFANGYEDGYCSNLKEHVIGTPSAQIYDTEFECCQENFADQTSGYCISQLPTNLQPSGQPTLGAVAGLGLSAQYVAVFANGYEDGYCSNLKEHVIGTPSAQIYETEFECCQENFADQKLGYCISQLPTNLQPSGQPTLGAVAGLGLSAQYVAVFANGYEDGYCSNLKEHVIGTPSAQIYESEFECCQENFADQRLGYCVSQLPSNLQPSGQPTLGAVAGLGLSAQYVAVFANGYEDGYCSNLKEHVIGTPSAQIYESEFECCQENFADQRLGYCISQLPTNLQPSGQPTLGAVAGLGLSAQYVAVFANGYEDGYCSNLKEHVIGTPSAQIYDTEFECCQENFADQTSGYCISQLPTNLQPSGQPTLGAVAGLGLSAQYVAVFANGYEDGYCSNLKEHVIGTPSAQIYETEFECCQENFADQRLGYCISQLPTNLQPSGQPTSLNNGLLGLDVWVPVWPITNSYESGYCSSKKEFVDVAYTQPFDSHLECCLKWFSMQNSGFCISEVEGGLLQPSSSPTIIGGGLKDAKFFPRFPGVGTPPATERYCDNDHNVLPQWQLDNYDSMGFDTQEECCDAWFPELTTACTRRLPTFGTLPPLPASCGFYPEYSSKWETGTCVNDCNHPPNFESVSNLLFSDDEAGGIECCNTWFENNGLTQQQIGSARLSYCLEQLVLANPTFAITAPPTRAPVS